MAIRWIEVNSAVPTVGSVAGRSDTPPTGTGDAAVAAVQYIFSGANSYSVNHRIGAELARLEAQAESFIPAGGTDGALAHVIVSTTTDVWSGMSAASFRGINLVGPPYHFSNPAAGIRLDRRTPQIFDSGTGAVSHRYFWGVRV